MSSVVSNSFKQSHGYFVTLAVLPSSSMYKAPVATGSGGSFTVAKPDAYTTLAAAELGAAVTALVSGAGLPANTLLKDMGKTVVSSSHTFRKVQPVVTGGPAVDGAKGEFYIEVATGQSAQNGAPGTGVGAAAKVAYLPGLW